MEENIGERGLLAGPDTHRILGERLAEAHREAPRYGRPVGIVSRFSPVEVDSSRARVVFDVDPSIYFSALDEANPLYRMGSILAILDPKTLHLISVRVVSITRLDELARIGVEEPLASPVSVDASTLMTRTKITGEILLEYDPETGSVIPANLSIEPQSPVIDPYPEVLVKLLGLPPRGEGVVLGALTFNSVPVKQGAIPVVLPVRVMLQHTLILGTTGSGKTTLLKNMIAHLSSTDNRLGLVVFDLNQDYIQLLMPPTSRRDTGGLRVYEGVKEPDKLIIVAPVSRDIIGAKPSPGGWESLLRSVYNDYHNDSLAPLLNALDIDAEEEEPTLEGPGLAHRLRLNGAGKKLYFTPYTIRTTGLTGDALASLMPGLTSHARDILRRVKKRVEYASPHGSPKPFIDLYLEGVKHYVYHAQTRDSRVCSDYYSENVLRDVAGRLKLQYQWISRELESAVNNYAHIPLLLCRALEDASPHRSTLENLARELGTLAETGIVDVVQEVRDGVLHFLGEPSWPGLVSVSTDEKAPLVVDLAWSHRVSSLGENTHRVVAIRMLETLLGWKQRAWRERRETPRVIVFIDEAHQFFPNEARDERARALSSVLGRIARLGRARGIGLVFATHTLGDLNDVVVQLTNTKIIMRMDPIHLDRLDLPAEYKRFLALAPQRHFLVKSYYIPNGTVTGVTSLPLTMHFDVSSGF